MAGLKVQTAQTDYVNSLAEIKSWLKVDGSDDDTVLGSIRIASDQWAQNYTGRTLTTQTYELFLDTVYDLENLIDEGIYTGIDVQLPKRNIVLPRSPVASISHVKYYDEDDTATTWATSNYRLDNASLPAKFTLKKGISYPTGLRQVNGFEIKYVAGYGASANVPQQIKQACLMYSAYLNEHRGDLVDGKSIDAPILAKQLLEPYRVKRMSTNPYQGEVRNRGIY
tara:strand:- start:9023 stop:9697 length:675 start_codon:yes stop_codon:yes gene_type:complete